MWNEGENWRPWDNRDLNYRPVRSRQKHFRRGLRREFPPDQGFFNGPVYSGYPDPVSTNFTQSDSGYYSRSRPAANPQDQRTFEFNPFSSSWPTHAPVGGFPYPSSPPQPETINFLNLKTATECDRRDCEHSLRLYHGDHLLESIDLMPEDEEFRFKTIPGMEYSIFLKIKSPNGRVLATGEVTIKATFSLQELFKLMNKAISFCEQLGNHKRAFRVVYRCKPQFYWDTIRDSWDGIMMKYVKDENGQAACPINGALYGLFFSAKVLKNGELPPTSPFGDTRMRIPAEDLLDPVKHNMYFADFYCNKEVHYVTIVVCVKNSSSDSFCRRKLIYLDPNNNPFLMGINRTRYCEFFTATGVHVEIFYTESIPINLGHFEQVKTVGMGSSRIGGLRHNKYCTVCNLYPVVSPRNNENNNEYEDINEDKWTRLDNMVDELRPMGLTWRDCDDVARTLDELVEKVSEDKESDDFEVRVAFGGFIPHNPDRKEFKNKGIGARFRNFGHSISKKFHNNFNKVHNNIFKKEKTYKDNSWRW